MPLNTVERQPCALTCRVGKEPSWKVVPARQTRLAWGMPDFQEVREAIREERIATFEE